ncbi:ATP-binding cassette domain-containing protein [Motiliproteus coralliicola]|uniref:ATP-binding cassette domain-containing protein n=2 Tax=Motiliproteus coralliicola TaxID=2283196 RepID=A0A369WVZ2_9GAMM|nr:ATP-binding cassette domain-containing protein [Motiliproteus coralliicola]
MVNDPPLLRVDGLSFRYGPDTPTDALGSVDFSLHAGRFHALLGPNGAGKSTLFGLISRLLRIQQGDIRLNGLSLKQAPARVLQGIGMVFQQSTLDLDLSVEDNLHYHASLHGLGGKHRIARIETELSRVELLNRRGDKVRKLNGGHRRRVEIARALLHQPQLLLLDEASVGLDSHTRTQINRHIRRLCRDQGVGVLWATHLIEEIQSGDPVTLLHRGRVIANADAEQICRETRCGTLLQAFETLTSESPLDQGLVRPQGLQP